MSVLTCFKNEDAYLDAVFRAVAGQRVDGGEVRVVEIDNESTDRSRGGFFAYLTMHGGPDSTGAR